MDNTEGFSQEELDKMNAEVEEEMYNFPMDERGNLPEYYNAIRQAEEKILKKYGGA
ncbi:MAG: hypothetical protein WC178_04285 [Candidatus Paceibacterota bacterium]